MISKTAEADVEDMWDAGLKPTFQDIIRLNAIALRVEHTKNGFSLSELPRVAFLGGVIFHEPTIGSEMWITSASRIFDSDDSQTMLILKAFSLSMLQEELPDPYDKEVVLKAIQDFKDKIAFATIPQLLAAVGYAIHGFKHDACENPTPKKSDIDNNEDDSIDKCYEIGLLRQGIIYRLGNADELKKLPAKVLNEMIMSAMTHDLKVDIRKDFVSIAEDDYLRTLDEITARLKGKTNG